MDLIQKACNLGFILKNKEYYLWELQKWLREEHKLSVEVYFNNGWDYDICDLETNLQNITEPHEYKTFENAFEVALMTALNMIKQDFA